MTVPRETMRLMYRAVAMGEFSGQIRHWPRLLQDENGDGLREDIFAASSASTGPNLHPLAQTPLGGLLDEVQRHDRHDDENHVADPGIVLGEMQLVQNMRVVDQVPEIEVQQVKTVTGFAHEDQRPYAERAGQRIVAGEAQNDASEQRHQQAVMDYRVG